MEAGRRFAGYQGLTMQRKMHHFSYVLAGLRNRPGRNLATLFCFAFIAANIFSGQFLIYGAAGALERGVSRMGADHLIVPSQYKVFLRGGGAGNTVAIVMAEPSVYRFPATVMEEIRDVPGVSAMSPQLYVSTLTLHGVSPAPVHIYGIDPETDFTITPWLEKPPDASLGSGELIAGHDIAGKVSDSVVIGGRTFTIAGRLDPMQSSADQTIFLRLDDAYALAAAKDIVPPSSPRIVAGDVNAVLVRDAPGNDRDAIGKRIARLFASSPGYGYVSVIGRHFSLDPAAGDIRAVPSLLYAISAFVVISALPLIGLIAAMVAHERQREIGLLKSMGAKRRTVFILVIAESLILAAAGGIAGTGMSLIVLILMNTQGILNGALQVSFRIPSAVEIGTMAGLALLVVIVIGSLSAFWPAYQCSSMNPYDAIRQSK